MRTGYKKFIADIGIYLDYKRFNHVFSTKKGVEMEYLFGNRAARFKVKSGRNGFIIICKGKTDIGLIKNIQLFKIKNRFFTG